MKTLFVIVAVAGFIVAGVYFVIDRDQNKDQAVRACAYNPAYVGVTPEDSRQLFLQCISDYSMAGR